MEEVTVNNLSSSLRENLLGAINKFVEDPRSSNRHFVYTQQPEVKAANFGGYPYIVLKQYGTSDDFRTSGNDYSRLDSRAVIEVYALRQSVQHKKYFDQISDQLEKLFIAEGSRGFLSKYNLIPEEILRNHAWVDRSQKDKPVMVREMEVTFRSEVDL